MADQMAVQMVASTADLKVAMWVATMAVSMVALKADLKVAMMAVQLGSEMAARSVVLMEMRKVGRLDL